MSVTTTPHAEHGRARSRVAIIATLALTLGNLVLHKPISDVCDWARARWGFPRYDRAALIAIPLLTLVALVPLLRRHAARWRSPLLWCTAVSLAVMTLASQRWMLVANIELIHFPQFGLIAGLLLIAGLAAEPAWLLATAAGILDETYQQLVIYRDRADTYLDFNDMILNAIGAAWIIVAFAPRAVRDGASPEDHEKGAADEEGPTAVPAVPSASERAARTGAKFNGWLRWPRAAIWPLVFLPVALWLDPPQLTPFLRPTMGARPYRVLSLTEALIWGTLLWGLVVTSTSDRQDRPPRATRSLTAARTLVLLLAVGGALQHASAPSHAVTAAPFITTFWCGPPLPAFDDARAAEIAAAGFTVVGPPCEGPRHRTWNLRALDVAARHGLGMWVADNRYGPNALEQADWQQQIAAAVADYRNHPAFAGYFVVDEPTAELFDTVAQIVAALHAHDPTHVAYVNLLPDYIKPDRLGTADYTAYVDEFITAVRPRLLSYDYYPFGKEKDRSSFFTNLTLIRDRALRHRLPFMLIVLAMPHGPYREPSEAELAWQVFHALAFGARGISYFAYWTPVNVAHAEEMQFRYGLIETGRATASYFGAQRLNHEVRAVADELATYHSVAVADALGDVAIPLPIGPLASIDGGAVTAGFFADDEDYLAVLLVNRDYRYATDIMLGLRPPSALPELFDAQRRRWVRLPGTALRLPPGRGRLLRWRQ